MDSDDYGDREEATVAAATPHPSSCFNVFVQFGTYSLTGIMPISGEIKDTPPHDQSINLSNMPPYEHN